MQVSLPDSFFFKKSKYVILLLVFTRYESDKQVYNTKCDTKNTSIAEDFIN